MKVGLFSTYCCHCLLASVALLWKELLPLLASVTRFLRWHELANVSCTQAWEMSSRLLELGGVYESFGAFEGALSIYQRIASSMAPSAGFENVLFRCAVVMRYMASLEVHQM